MVILNNSKEGKNFCTKGTSIGAHRKKILRNRKIRKHRETVVEKKRQEGGTNLPHAQKPPAFHGIHLEKTKNKNGRRSSII